MQIIGNNLLLMTVMIFVAVILMLESLYLVWRARRGPEARKLQARLHDLAHRDVGEARVLKEGAMGESGPLERVALSLPQAEMLTRLLQQAGLGWSGGKWLLLSAGSGIATLVVLSALLHQGMLLNLAAAAAAALWPSLHVLRQRDKRLRKLEQQLPEALDLMARGLRAGHAFSSTLKMAGEELPDPIGQEFRTVHDEINYGIAIQQALTNLAERVPSTDVRYFVVAVLIQRESGGNLTEILGNLSHLIRARLKLLGRVRVLSAEGRLSALILVLMPFALGGLLTVANPTFMSRLWTDPIGISMLKVMLGLMALGVILLRKIVRIRV